MTGNIRKLALDPGPAWVLPFQIISVLAFDYLYLLRPDNGTFITGGVMLSLQASFALPKVALWRTLPVTAREIGQARWWQMIGLPGLAIIALMAVALALYAIAAALGWIRHAAVPGATTLLLCMLGEFFYPVFLTIFLLAINHARATRAPLAIAGVVAVWLPFVVVFRHADFGLSLQESAVGLGLAALPVAVILYLTAPKWPLPIVQPFQFDFGRGKLRGPASGKSGQGGWVSLCATALSRTGLMLGAVLALQSLAILMLHMTGGAQFQLLQFVPFIVIWQMTLFNAQSLRLLRALPGSSLRLAAYLFFLPLAVLAVTLCAISWLLLPLLTKAEPAMDVVAPAIILLVSALTLPAALSLRQTAMGLVLSLTLVLVPVMRLAWNYVPSPWQDERLLIGLSIAAMVLGFFWMHARVSRSMRVYQFQPFVAPRWRGSD
jgi:hypothetical protein